MKTFRVEQKLKITKGYMWKQFTINAETEEEVKTLVENNDAEKHCYNIEYDIEQSEHLGISIELK